MLQIFLIRHGQTEANLNKVVQGRSLDLPLNTRGKEQANAFYEAYADEGFELVLCSSLKRSRQSVDHFIKEGIPHLVQSDIDEFDWGLHEGQSHSETLRNNFYQLISDWQSGDADARLEGGESLNELEQRIRRFLDFLISRNEKKILICSHGRTIRCMIRMMLEENTIDMEKYKHTNLSLFVFQYLHHRFAAVRLNDTEHLKNEKRNEIW